MLKLMALSLAEGSFTMPIYLSNKRKLHILLCKDQHWVIVLPSNNDDAWKPIILPRVLSSWESIGSLSQPHQPLGVSSMEFTDSGHKSWLPWLGFTYQA